MKYFVKREQQEYGPYTLADLQAYVQQGNILPTDIGRSEGMTDWVPVSSIIGTISVPAAGSFGAAPATALASHPDLPPNLHWGAVVLLSIVTFGIFAIIWLFVQSAWLRKVRPENKSLVLLAAYFGCTFVSGVVSSHSQSVAGMLNLAAFVLFIVGIFTLRSGMEDYFNSDENIGLRLSGIMTFFFHTMYFQYHFNDAARRRLGAAA